MPLGATELGQERNQWLAAALALEMVGSTSDASIVEKVVGDLKLRYDTSSADEALKHHVEYLRERGARELMPKPRAFEVL